MTILKRAKVWLFAAAGLAAVAVVVILYQMEHIPKGMQAAPNPSPAGIVQLLLSILATFGFSGAGTLAWILEVYHKASTVKPVDSGMGPISTSGDSMLGEINEAFVAYIADRTNTAKSRRFWFDLCEFGIALDPDEDTKAWLQQGTEILRKKYFPAAPKS